MKRVLITGGSRGIGVAIKTKYESENYEIIAPDRSDLNLSDDASIEMFISHQKKPFDVIINNAGINELNLVEDITDESIQKTLQINLIAPMKLLRGLVPKMKENHSGRIINIASIWAVVSKEKRLTYSVSKNAIHGITNTLAIELAPFNILVNTVCPGFTGTELTYKNNTDEQIAELCKEIPLSRLASPDEIADIVYYLGSNQNTYITGQKVVIDGGYTIK